ncbi:MAG: iron ABC transporter permease [Butyrivibrio sp.]|uniref:FecCD family ABC transporter permease n=1 Tax=Butyrivibrio sp. TaxID=28121 RepID=UPI001B03405A|nr:iron ABC transporter permease [Butyrivibrio sp.]MBO6239637.1 iron ABC transporter permease [Butyrivibrio sp.]
MSKKRNICFFSLAVILIVGLMWINTAVGSTYVSPAEVFDILFGKNTDSMHMAVIWQIRLPRCIAAFFLGGALALSGYLLQTFFGNPIVGPFVLGISSGAKLCVALIMIFFLSKGKEIGLGSMVISAFFGSLLSVVFVLAVSVKVKSMSVLVICGIMIGYVCSAITDFVVTFADDSNIVNLHNWSMGSFSGINWDEIIFIGVIVVFGLVIALLIIKPMNAYRLGESYARSVGVNITAFRVILILLSSLLAACVTAFAGPISFVGIAVPHLSRSILKTDASYIMIPASFLGGSLVTLFCDLLARSLFAPTEVSISSVTAVFLVPVVIFMMIKRTGKNYMQ